MKMLSKVVLGNFSATSLQAILHSFDNQYEQLFFLTSFKKLHFDKAFLCLKYVAITLLVINNQK